MSAAFEQRKFFRKPVFFVQQLVQKGRAVASNIMTDTVCRCSGGAGKHFICSASQSVQLHAATAVVFAVYVVLTKRPSTSPIMLLS